MTESRKEPAEGRLERIWIKRARRGPMDAVPEARAAARRGLVGSADQGGRRQVTVISAEAWRDAEEELGSAVEPSARRANLLVTGLDLEGSRGRTLVLGEVRLRVWGETVPCERMDEARAGLRRALSPSWRGGVYGELLNDGVLRVGDVITWEG